MKFPEIRMNKNQKIVAGAAAVLLAVGIGGPISSARFSSTTPATVKAQTGHVEIALGEQTIAASNLLPGVPQAKDFRVDNTKSTAAVSLSVSRAFLSLVPNRPGIDPSKLTFEIQDNDGNVLYGPVQISHMTPGPINAVVPAGQWWAGKAVFKLDESAGNEYQDFSVTTRVEVTGTQVN